MYFKTLSIVCCAGVATLVIAGESPFRDGPVITQFGKIAAVNSDLSIPDEAVFKIVFDVGEKAQAGQINRTFDSAARFINMHVDAGVPVDNIEIAIVVHGGAAVDVTKQSFYGDKNKNEKNASAMAIETLLKHRVEVFICGQSAVAHGIGNDDLLPGVRMALSAMTAHALLLRDGFTPNPF